MIDSILPPHIDYQLIDELRGQLPKSSESRSAREPFTGAMLPEVPQSDTAAVERAAETGRATQPVPKGAPRSETRSRLLAAGLLSRIPLRANEKGPPDSYPDRTSTGKRRRAYEPAINRLHDQPPTLSGRTGESQ
jgi:hypothetical protein